MNRKAQLISIWMFLVWIIILAGIAGLIWMFYSAEVDVRGIEAESLYDKIINCVTENGHLAENFGNNFDILSECKINKDIIENEENYYFSVDVYSLDNEKLYEVIAGARGMGVLCGVGGGKSMPKCSEKSILVLDKNNKEVRVEVLTASNNQG